MQVIELEDRRVIYRASKGKKVKFINDPKSNLYDEIEVKERNDDKIVEVKNNG